MPVKSLLCKNELLWPGTMCSQCPNLLPKLDMKKMKQAAEAQDNLFMSLPMINKFIVKSVFVEAPEVEEKDGGSEATEDEVKEIKKPAGKDPNDSAKVARASGKTTTPPKPVVEPPTKKHKGKSRSTKSEPEVHPFRCSLRNSLIDVAQV